MCKTQVMGNPQVLEQRRPSTGRVRFDLGAPCVRPSLWAFLGPEVSSDGKGYPLGTLALENHRAYQWAYHHQVHHQVRHGQRIQRIQRIHETKQWRDIQKIIENPMLTYSTSCSKRDGMGPSLPDLGTEPNLRTANSSTWLFDDFVWGVFGNSETPEWQLFDHKNDAASCSPESWKLQHSSTWGSRSQCFPPPRLFQPPLTTNPRSFLRVHLKSFQIQSIFLVGGFKPPLWKMMEFVNWDDDRNPIYIFLGKFKKTWQPFTTNPIYLLFLVAIQCSRPCLNTSQKEAPFLASRSCCDQPAVVSIYIY